MVCCVGRYTFVVLQIDYKKFVYCRKSEVLNLMFEANIARSFREMCVRVLDKL